MPLNACDKFNRELSAYLDQELPEKDRVRLKTHLDSCSSCSEELARLSALDSGLKSLPAMGPSPFFAARTAAAARALGEYHGPYRRFLRLSVPAMALLLALITLNLFSFAININAMEPAQRHALLQKVASCMEAPGAG